MSELILVVDDEQTVREVVRKYLEREGYRVVTVETGPEALEAVARHSPNLVVLDLMLPGLSGEEVCRRLRGKSDLPIIMLTARVAEGDRLQGLELGADDYVIKPFSPRELVARVKAVLRRSAPVDLRTDQVMFGALELDGRARTLCRDGEPVALTGREFDLLWFMARHPGQVFSRSQLLEEVWGWEFEGDETTVTVHIRRLRSKIEPNDRVPRHLRTVWSAGYRFDA